MNVRRGARRVVRTIVHNWPLKVAAIVLAALLYAGLVATQGSNTYPGPIPVMAVNVPEGTTVTNQLKPIDEVRYIAPADLGLLTADDFHATVDLTGMEPTGTGVSVRVNVVAVDPRVTILEVRPRTIQVVIDRITSATVPVNIVRGAPPPGVQVGTTTYTPQAVKVTGAATAVDRVVSIRVDVAFDPSGLDYDQEVQGTPVDQAGAQVTGVELSPRTVHVTIPLYKDLQSRTVPVHPVLSGDPASGFRVAGVDVSPLAVTLQGDSDQLAQITAADTGPIPIYGATRSVTETVPYSLPTGITAVGAGTAQVTVRIEAVTEARTYAAGLRIDGQDPALTYTLDVQSVLLTVFGSSSDLDRLGTTPITVGIDASGMGPGVHHVPVVPSLPSGVSLVSIQPQTVTLTISGSSSTGSGGLPSGSAPTPTPTPS